MSSSSRKEYDLYHACWAGKKDEVIRLLSNGVMPRCYLSYRKTCLHLACQHGWFDIVKMLIEDYGCSPHDVDCDNHTPLYYARERGHSGIVQYLTGKRERSYTYKSAPSRDDDISLRRLLSTPPSKLTYRTQQVVPVKAVPTLSKVERRPQETPFCVSNQVARKRPDVRTTISGKRPDVHTIQDITKAVHSDVSKKVIISEKSDHEFVQHDSVIESRHEFELTDSVSSEYLLKLMTKYRQQKDKVLDVVKAFVNNNPNQKTVDGDTVLHLACYPSSYFKYSCHHSISVIQFLFSHYYKCEPNVENEQGKTPLQLTSDLQIMKELVQYGATTRTGDIFKLVLSASKIDLKESEKCEIMGLLRISLSNTNWSPSDKDGDGNTALHLACETDNMGIIKVLLSSNVEWNFSVLNNDGKALLDLTSTHEIRAILIEHGAAMSSENVQHLINHGEKHEIFEIIRGFLRIDPDRKTVNGDTLLHLVSKDSRTDTSCPYKLEIIHFLLDSIKCNPNVQDQKRMTPIQLTSSFEIMSELIKYHAITTADVIFRLVSNTTVENEIVKCAIRNTLWTMCDINKDGDTALHIACRASNHNVVKILLSRAKCQHTYDPKLMTRPPVSINIHMLNTAGKTPLQLVSDFQVMKKLIQHGATITADVMFKLVSNSVHASNEHEVVEVLQHSRSHQNVKWTHNDKDSDGNTALHIASKANQPAIVHFLLSDAKCHSDCKVKNNAGRSPPQLTSHLQIMKELIQHGATMTADVVFDVISNSNAMELDVIEVLQLSKESLDHKSTHGGGNTSLHLACKANRPAIVHFLLSEIHFDPNVKNDAGETPLDLATNNLEVVADLIRHGSKTSAAVTRHIQQAVGTKKTLLPTVKILIVGFPHVGKSTLTASLQKELPLLQSHIHRLFPTKVSGVGENTAGVIPYEYYSRTYGQVILYDFAGQREFYRGHAALLQSEVQVPAPIFLVVVDLREDEHNIGKGIKYWLSFLKNHINSEFMPHVIIVGSHADVLVKEDKDPHEKAKLVHSLLHHQYPVLDFISMNCQYPESPEITSLRRCLVKCCDDVRQVVAEAITPNAHCFYVYLLSEFSKEAAISLGSVQKRIRKDHQLLNKEKALYFLPVCIEVLHRICKELNDRGHILFLEDQSSHEKSWIIIRKDALLSEVIGTIFAPESSKQHHQIASNTGVLPLSKFTKHFPKQSPEMLVKFLSHFEYCHKIVDLELIATINKEYSQEECYLLCTALISQKAPDDMWEPRSDLPHQFGWILKCTDSEQYFSSRFLQVLLLRLAFSFPLAKQPKEVETSYPGIQRKCSIWKNGIFWGGRFGTQTLVEVIDNNKILVKQRFKEKYCVRTSHLRSQVIQKVYQCAKDFCSNIETIESFISPTSVWYPQIPSTMKTFTVQEIVDLTLNADTEIYGVSESGGTEAFHNLLISEPYMELQMPVFKELYSTQNTTSIIADNFIDSFAQEVSEEAIDFFKKILKFAPNNKDETYGFTVSDHYSLTEELKAWRKCCKGTYQCLRQQLDQCSVFAGRNILVIDAIHYMHMYACMYINIT